MNRVICIESQKIYDSCAHAAREIGGTRSGIRNAIKFNNGFYKNLHFEFYKGNGSNTTIKELRLKKELEADEKWEDFIQDTLSMFEAYGEKNGFTLQEVYQQFSCRTKNRFTEES